MKSFFITLEGPEGSGKSTQAARLVKRLADASLKAVRTREPGGTPTGEAIREILQRDKAGEPIVPEAEALLFAASRAQLVRRVILPALKRGRIVISDRFADSTTVYQGHARGLGVERMLDLNAFAVDAAAPDLTILIDVDVRLGFQRLARRHRKSGRDRMEREAIEFHENVRQGYLNLARRYPARFRVVDGSRSSDAVEADVWKLVKARLCAAGLLTGCSS
ncbi:MAG: dTMP kinase [Verrucomicrobiota bacterium]|nr:dTMP kinase [Verrucomicrobiota bacterium]